MFGLIDVVFSDAELSTMVGLVVIAVMLAMAWWEFYAKPCRDSLRAIEQALNAAPWMQRPQQQPTRRRA